jgi:beta-lactamase superfamily II metal-dependent hydrolase
VGAEHALRIHVIDVGQGAATLLEFPCGAILVDTGGEANSQFDSVPVLERTLEAFFARRTDLNRTLDVLLLTHPHLDHVRGVPLVMSRFNVRYIVDNGQPGDERVAPYLEELMNLKDPLRRRSVGNSDVGPSGLTDAMIDPVTCAPVDPVIRVLNGRQELDPGWGLDDYERAHFQDANNHSVVVRVDFGRASVLITGDLEEVALESLLAKYAGTSWLDADVYVVGHHGSHNGTTRALLDAVSPKMAILSVGPFHRHESWTAWQYGHPRIRTLELLNSSVLLSGLAREVLAGAGMRRFHAHRLSGAIYATAWDGTVVVEAAEDGRLRVIQPAPAPRSTLFQ